MDRIDLMCLVDRPTAAELTDGTREETSAEVAQRVAEARARAARRWRDQPWSINARVPGGFLRQSDLLSDNQRTRMVGLLSQGRVSMRGMDRILRVALTLADLEGRSTISDANLSTAYILRTTEATDALL